MRQLFLLCILCTALAGCAGENTSATLVAQNFAYGTEVVTINQTLAARATLVSGDAAAAATQIYAGEVVNRAFQATIAAQSTPTLVIQRGVVPLEAYGADAIATTSVTGIEERFIGANTAPDARGVDANATPLPSFGGGPASGSAGMVAMPGSAAGQFTAITTASAVNNTNGCATTVTSEFDTSANRIYVTARANNIVGGTVMRVEWRYYGQLAYQDGFTVSDANTDYCFWFYIGPEYLELQPGAWTAQLYANDIPLPPAAFTITEMMMDDAG
jgi:hypothetical protein